MLSVEPWPSSLGLPTAGYFATSGTEECELCASPGAFSTPTLGFPKIAEVPGRNEALRPVFAKECAVPKADGPAGAATGTQALERGIEILRALSRAGSAGLQLVDIQRDVALTRPTAHRLLGALIRNNLVEQIEETRRYRLTTELLTHGWSMLAWESELREICHPQLAALADESGDSAHLVVRSGFESLCLDRCVGTYPIKVLTVEVGARRPLGVGASGLALLAALPETEIEGILEVVAPRLGRYAPLTVDSIRRDVKAARANGYALSHGYEGQKVRGLAVPFRNRYGVVAGALSALAVRDRIPNARIAEVVEQIRRRCKVIEELLSVAPSFGSANSPDPPPRPKQHRSG